MSNTVSYSTTQNFLLFIVLDIIVRVVFSFLDGNVTGNLKEVMNILITCISIANYDKSILFLLYKYHIISLNDT